MCGLAAYVGTNYDPTLFKLISLAQDERGRDNAGIGCLRKGKADVPSFRTILAGEEPERIFKNVLNNNFVRGGKVYPVKTLGELFSKHLTLPETIDSYIFAHSRKATIGNGAALNAQPFIHQDTMLMHNGTITNHEQLAKVYKMQNYTSDSQLIALMINGGYRDDIFKEFEGYCTCIWGELSDPDAYMVFCGSDKHYQNNPPALRKPLYYVDTGDGVYSSSIKVVLEMLVQLLHSPDKYQNLEVETYSPNWIYRVSKDGVEKIKYISRKVRVGPKAITGPKEVPTSGSTHFNTLDNDYRNLLDEPDLLQYAAGRYYLNGNIATTMWKIDDEGETTYYPLYVSKRTFLVYKKLKNGEYVMHKTEKKCAEKLENLAAIPILEGILLKSWNSFFEITKDYANAGIYRMTQESFLPVNSGALKPGITSIYFMTSSGKLLNSTLYIPFTLKRYQFTKNIVTDILNVSVTFASKMTARYVNKVLKAATSTQEQQPPTEKDIDRKFKLLKRIIGKIPDQEGANKRHVQAAKALEDYLTQFFADEE